MLSVIGSVTVEQETESALSGSLKIQFGLNRIYSCLGAGFVGLAAGRSRDPDRPDQRAARLDDESAAKDDRARNIANASLHHAGLADGEQTARAAAERGRSPSLARSGCDCVRSRITIAQNDLDYAEAIDHGDGHLISSLLAVRERGLSQLEGNWRTQRFVADERFLRAARIGNQQSESCCQKYKPFAVHSRSHSARFKLSIRFSHDPRSPTAA